MHAFNFFLLLLLTALLQGGCGSRGVAAELYAPVYHGYWPGHRMGPPSAPVRDARSGKIDFFAECSANVSGGTSQPSQGWYHFSSSNYSIWYRDHDSPFLGEGWWYNSGGTLAGSASFNSKGEEVILYTCKGSDGINRICQGDSFTIITAKDRLATQLTQSALNPIFPSSTSFGSGSLDSGSTWSSPSRFFSSSTTSNQDLWYLIAVATDKNNTAMVGLFSTTDALLQNGISYKSVMYRDGNFSSFGTPEIVDLTSTTSTLTPVPSSSSYTYLLKLTMIDAQRDYVVYGTLSLSNATGAPEFVEDVTHPPTMIDFGIFKESKVFTDTITRTLRVVGYLPEDLVDPETQTITQGWSGALSIPRVLTYNKREQRIAFAPMPEIKSLRQSKLFENVNSPCVLSPVTSTTFLENRGEVLFQPLTLSSTPTSHYEIVVRFQLPEGWMKTVQEGEEAPEVGIFLKATSNFSSYTSVGVQMPTTSTCNSTSRGVLFRQMPLRGAFNDSDTSACQNLCLKNSMCEKWETVLRTYGMDCYLYTASGDTANEEGACGTQSGCPLSFPYLVMDRSLSGTVGNTSTLRGRAALRTSSPQLLELRVFVDNSIIEVFKDDGLEVLSGRVYLPEDQNGMAVYAKNVKDGMNITASVQVFSMRGMWAPEGEMMSAGLDYQEIRAYTNSLHRWMNAVQ